MSRPLRINTKKIFSSTNSTTKDYEKIIRKIKQKVCGFIFMIVLYCVRRLFSLYQLELDQDVKAVHDDMFFYASEHDSEEEVQSISLESLLSDFNLEKLYALLHQ